MPSPGVHNPCKLGEIFRSGVRVPRLVFFASSGDVPEISPFGIEGRWHRCHRLVIVAVEPEQLGVVSSFFCELGRGSNLETIFRVHILCFLSFVEIFSTFAEIFLHHIQELVILGLVNPRVFDDQASVFCKGFGYLLTVGFGRWAFGQESFDIDDWHFD